METDDILDRLQASLDGFPTYVPGLIATAKDEIARLRAIVELSLRALRDSEERDDGTLLQPAAAKALNDALDRWEAANPDWDMQPAA
jgi:hypothetical protein